MSGWTVRYLTLSGWVAADGDEPPPGAAKICRRRKLFMGAVFGSRPLPVWEEVLDLEAAAALVKRYGERPDG